MSGFPLFTGSNEGQDRIVLANPYFQYVNATQNNNLTWTRYTMNSMSFGAVASGSNTRTPIIIIQSIVNAVSGNVSNILVRDSTSGATVPATRIVKSSQGAQAQLIEVWYIANTSISDTITSGDIIVTYETPQFAQRVVTAQLINVANVNNRQAFSNGATNIYVTVSVPQINTGGFGIVLSVPNSSDDGLSADSPLVELWNPFKSSGTNIAGYSVTTVGPQFTANVKQGATFNVLRALSVVWNP